MLMKYRGRWRSRRGTPLSPPARRARSMSAGLRAIVGRSGLDLDLPRLDLLRLRDVKGQDPVGEGCLRSIALDPDRQLQRSAEGAVAPLAVQILVAVDRFVGLELATQGERLAGHRDLHVLGLEAGERRGHDDLIRGLVNVEGRAYLLAGHAPPAEWADPRV